MLIRPFSCPNGDRVLSHDWGSLFLFEKNSIIRVFGFPQPPHVLPKYILERLGQLQFFWQLSMMNKEYLGPTIKKGSFVARNTKVGDFLIGKDVIEEIAQCMGELKLPSTPAGTYDPNDLVRHSLKNMRKYTLPSSKPNWEEDCIMNYL